MTLTLILLRHAKSGWDDPMAEDHARILTERGRAAAQAIGGWLKNEGHKPDLILSSNATRTAQTVQGVITALGTAPDVRYERALYHAAPDTMLRHIKKQAVATLLVCGHNPGIGALAQRLVTRPPHHPRFDDYPTAATTVISFDVDQWADIRQGRCDAFVIPADLRD